VWGGSYDLAVRSRGNGKRSNEEVLARIVAAARKCFAEHGVSKTWIAVIAEEAGMARQNVYAYVSSREELIELAFAARAYELKPIILERLDPHAEDLADAIVECLAVLLEVSIADREFNEYTAGLGVARALQWLTGRGAPHDVVREVMRPYYARAVEEGVIRNNVSLDEVAWWSRNILAPLVVHDELDASHLREVLKKLALPAFIHTDDS
jgi:AcrR family transcriptional regulator